MKSHGHDAMGFSISKDAAEFIATEKFSVGYFLPGVA